MLKMNAVLEHLSTLNGTKGEITEKYLWFSGDKSFGPMAIESIADIQGLYATVGQPDEVFCFMEITSTPLDMEKEEYTEYMKKLKVYEMENGTFEGFEGLIQYLMHIGYDGSEFVFNLIELNIDEEGTRTFGKEFFLNSDKVAGPQAKTLWAAYHARIPGDDEDIFEPRPRQEVEQEEVGEEIRSASDLTTEDAPAPKETAVEVEEGKVKKGLLSGLWSSLF